MANMNAQVTLSLRDKMLGRIRKNTRAFKGMRRELKGMRGAAAGVTRATRDMARQNAKSAHSASTLVKQFRAQKQASQGLKAKLTETQNKLRNLAREGKRSGREFSKLRTTARQLKNQLGGVNQKLEMNRRKLQKVAGTTRNLGRVQRKLKGDLSAATAELNRQEKALERVARREKALDRLQARRRQQRNNRMMRGAAVAAIARVKAGGKQDNMLRRNARELGATTSYSAMEAAQGQEYLALAGFDPKAIVASMGQILSLAKAGRIEIGLASDIGSAFDLEKNATGIGRMADVLIGTSTRANANVTQLGETMKYAAPGAKDLGISLETTSAMAGVLADNGIKGSMAGTSLKAIMSRLAAGTGEAGKAMKQIGLRTKDANGNFLPMVDILQQIQDKTKGMGTAKRSALLSQLAGLEAQGSLSKLVDEKGLNRVRELIRELAKAKGEADQVAKRMGDNLPGDIKSANSALAELGLVIGKQIEPAMRSLVQWFTRATRKLTAFAREHPNLVKWLGLAAVGLGAFLTIGGTIATVLGAGMVAMAAMRFSMFMMGATARRSGRQVRGLRGGMMGLGRMKPLRWGRFIKPIAWAALIGALVWSVAVSDLTWSDFVSPVKWREWVGQLDWDSVITVLSIASFIMPFRWVTAIPKLMWRTLISPLRLAKFIVPMTAAGWKALLNIGALTGVLGGLKNKLAMGGLLGGKTKGGTGSKTKGVARGKVGGRGALMGLGMGMFMVNEMTKSREEQRATEKATSEAYKALNAEMESSSIWQKWVGFRTKTRQMIGLEASEPPVDVPKATAPPKTAAGNYGSMADAAGDFRSYSNAVAGAKSAAQSVPKVTKSAVSQSEATLNGINWAMHGLRMMSTMAQGVRNGGALVKDAVSSELAKARALLPSSNAKEGPLSNLTGNGRSILETMARGVREGGDGGLARRLGQSLQTAAPLMPQLAAAGAPVGQMPGMAPAGSAGAGGQQSNTTNHNNFVFNITSNSPEDAAKQVEKALRGIMHDKLND